MICHYEAKEKEKKNNVKGQIKNALLLTHKEKAKWRGNREEKIGNCISYFYYC